MSILQHLSLLAFLLYPSIASSSSESSTPPAIVIGFVGGFVRHDDPVRGGVQLAARLRKDYGSSVYVKVFENYRREEARQQILRLLSANNRGAQPTEQQKHKARLIIYGVSWGGSETVRLARKLKDDGIPVTRTIQVDSVQKIGERDDVIPPNVAEAANFYQVSGLLHGRREIRAENPATTRIAGNFRYDYSTSTLKCEGYPWRQRFLFRTHVQIECDPQIWSRVEALIRSALPLPQQTR